MTKDQTIKAARRYIIDCLSNRALAERFDVTPREVGMALAGKKTRITTEQVMIIREVASERDRLKSLIAELEG